MSSFRRSLPSDLNVIGAKQNNGKFEVDLKTDLTLNDVHSVLVIGKNKSINDYKHSHRKS